MRGEVFIRPLIRLTLFGTFPPRGRLNGRYSEPSPSGEGG